MVQVNRLGAGDILDHLFQDRTGRFDQMSPYLLQQVSSLFGRKRLDQLLFVPRSKRLKADYEKIAQRNV